MLKYSTALNLETSTITCQRFIKSASGIIRWCIGFKQQDQSKRFEIYIQNPRYDLKVQQSQSMFSIMKILHDFILSKAKIPLELSAISESSHDYNQTVHLTLDYDNLNTFWSSAGSDSSESYEHLWYQITEGLCAISSFSITAFQALYQNNDPIYYPRTVRFLVGWIPDNYHYVSDLYQFEPDATEQYFYTLPDLVIGKYVKIELYGKPQIQTCDGLYLITLQKVTVNGWFVESFEVPNEVEDTLKTIVDDIYKQQYDQPLPLNFEDSKIDEIDDEAFKSAEALIIKLTNPEEPVKLTDFLSDNNIDDIIVWLEKHRIVLKNSESAWKHLDQPSDLGETDQFYRYGVSILRSHLNES